MSRGSSPKPAKPKPSTFRRVLHWAEVVLVLAVVVFWFFELRPVGLGGNASYAIVSGTSMNPLYHTGDVVIVHKHANYKVGDIVAYKVPKPAAQAGLEVIHRLIGGNGTTGWTVKGDNRTAPDLWHPKNSDVVGSAWVHIPSAGVVVRYLHTPIGIAAILAVLAMGAVFKKAPGGDKKKDNAPAVAASPPPDPAPDPVVPAAPVTPVSDGDEVARLTAVVHGLQSERASLQARLDAMRHELESARAALTSAGGADPARQRELERALTEALLSAARAGAELRFQAHQEAEAIIAEARERAARLEDERSRTVAGLESIRDRLESSIVSFDEGGEAAPETVVDLFDAERRRASGDSQ